jgi:hypothetical protein
MTSKQLFLTIFFWNKWINPLHKGDKKETAYRARETPSQPPSGKTQHYLATLINLEVDNSIPLYDLVPST